MKTYINFLYPIILILLSKEIETLFDSLILVVKSNDSIIKIIVLLLISFVFNKIYLLKIAKIKESKKDSVSIS
ncbi:hypothetical protein [Tepidibacter sp. Z1-5]|uniref:hypothetical protein n=1 Tax=Tepidibacter sp. Z1-5 TaxID=3134138 RepID=UPI0030BADFE7